MSLYDIITHCLIAMLLWLVLLFIASKTMALGPPCYLDDTGVVRRSDDHAGYNCRGYRKRVAKWSHGRIGGHGGAWLLCYALDPQCGAVLRAHLPIPTDRTWWLYFDTQEEGYHP